MVARVLRLACMKAIAAKEKRSERVCIALLASTFRDDYQYDIGSIDCK